MQTSTTYLRLIFLAAALVAANGSDAQERRGLTDAHRGGAASDPALVVGPERCSECHKSEFAAWQEMRHAKTFVDMHRKPRANEIVTALGGKRIKTNEHCMTCHYTAGLRAGRAVARWGVTCESCHSAGLKWVDVHNDFGAGATKDTESAAHRTERLAKAVAAGMIRPSNLYAVAANCFQCHTIPDEELVNVGGHKARSEFELVSWSQGEMRHNYQHTGDQTNRPASPERKRMLYVVGRALELEYALRGAGRVTQAGPFVDNARSALAAAISHLEKIQAATSLAEIGAMLDAAKPVKVGVEGAALAATTADTVAAAARKLAAREAAAFAGVDGLLPASSVYRGTARP